MRKDAVSKTPTNSRKPNGNIKTTDSGKKLVQARLPFKIITSSPVTSAAENVDADKCLQAKKRKLSDEFAVEIIEENDVQAHNTTQNASSSKNTEVIPATITANKKTKTETEPEPDIIIVDDENNFDEKAVEDVIVVPDPKVIIKLPLSGKKAKRRKSMRTPEDVNLNAEADIEEMSPSFKLNPLKRTKIDEALLQTNDEEKTEHVIPVVEIDDDAENRKDADTIEENSVLEKNVTKNEDNIKKAPIVKEMEATLNTEDNEKMTKVVEEESTSCQSKNSESCEENLNATCTADEPTIIESSNSEDMTKDDEAVVVVEEGGEGPKKKNLTAKQLKLMEQRRQAREEKERKLSEEKQLKQLEKEKREEAKKVEREQREEQRRKEREERDEKKRLEREEKERKRQAECAAKNEEKRKRNEAREEELREKEEERKRKDEEKNMKFKKAAEVFTKFFVPKSNVTSNKREVENNLSDEEPNMNQNKKTLAFRPFQVKDAMKLAPICRRELNNEQRKNLDFTMLQNNPTADGKDVNSLYLSELRVGTVSPIKWKKLASNEPKETNDELEDDDILIIDEFSRAGQEIVEEKHTTMKCLRGKYYKFHENRRPPYFGTWRKSSKVITARRPFAQDLKNFDYEVDSDLEWEEEEPGELLEDSDADEKDKESENDDYDVDNEWMVPHGHLSDEEMQHEDEFGDLCIEGIDNDNNTREAQKAKLKVLQQEFAMEMKKKTTKIQPRLVGCIWVDENGNQPSTCSNLIWQSIKMRAMLFNKSSLLEDINNNENANNSPKHQNQNMDGSTIQEKAKPIILTDKMLKELVRLVHGNSLSKQFLIKEFIAHIASSEATITNGEFCVPLKSTVRRKIDKLAEWKKIEENNSDNQNDKDNNLTKIKKNKSRLCWVVRSEMLTKMGLEHLGLQNEWHYLLSPRKPLKSSSNNNNNISNIAIEKVADEVENNKITANASSANEDTTNKIIEDPKITTATIEPKACKKRVPLLMSVARGQQIPTAAKNALISQFLKKKDAASVDENESTSQQNVDDNVVILD